MTWLWSLNTITGDVNLYEFGRPRRVVHEASSVDLRRQRLFQRRVASPVKDDAWEEVVDKWQEERLIAVYELR